ncbi:MAG: septum formation initiator family protein [Anaerovoracaceae bacterium]
MRKRKGRIRDFERNNRAVDFDEAREERLNRLEVARQKKSSQPKDEPSERGSKKKVRFNKVRVIIAVIILTLIAVVGMSIKDVVDLRLEQDELKSKNELLKDEKDNLQAELENLDSYDYIEEQARIQLRLIKPGEILLILENGKESQDDGEK